MNVLGLALLAASVSATAASDARPASALPSGILPVEGAPLAVAAFEHAGGVDVLLLRDSQLDRYRVVGRHLERTGVYRPPVTGVRPLRIDTGRLAAGSEPRVTVVFGEDIRGVDQGTDTRLHAYVLVADEGGGLTPASDDLHGWLRIADGRIFLQRRGPDAVGSGTVTPVEAAAGRYAPRGGGIAWGGRSLLEATPLGGGELLAWDGDRPVIVTSDRGRRVGEGALLGDLGHVEAPSIAVRTDRPILRGIDGSGRTKDLWYPLPRRVAVSGDDAYTFARERSAGTFAKASGADAVVRLTRSDGSLEPSQPFPALAAFIIDFAILEGAAGSPVALVLVNDRADGTGDAHLVVQHGRAGADEPSQRRPPSSARRPEPSEAP